MCQLSGPNILLLQMLKRQSWPAKIISSNRSSKAKSRLLHSLFWRPKVPYFCAKKTLTIKLKMLPRYISYHNTSIVAAKRSTGMIQLITWRLYLDFRFPTGHTGSVLMAPNVMWPTFACMAYFRFTAGAYFHLDGHRHRMSSRNVLTCPPTERPDHFPIDS